MGVVRELAQDLAVQKDEYDLPVDKSHIKNLKG
jgi:hypothetical protein